MALRAMADACDKIRELTKELTKMKDPARKERRQFSVCVAEVVFERVLCLSLGKESYTWYPFQPPVKTASHSYLPRLGKNGAGVSNVTLDALYLLSDEPEQELVPIRLSTKTKVAGDKRTSVKQKVLRTLLPYALKRPVIDEFTVFTLLDPSIDTRLLDRNLDLGDIPFFADLIRVVLDNVGRKITEDVVNDFYDKHPRQVEASLKVKLYYNRGDLRAYVSDTCLPRAVSGAIVNALVRPKSLKLRKKLHVAKSGPWPAEKGNRLDRCVTCNHGVRVLLILGDVSSFTGSCSSSWALLLAATQALERNPKLKHLNKPIVFVVDNMPFECPAHIAFRVYLYYATMMPVLDTTTNEVFVSAGGMLGVNGNINLTLLAFSIVLMDLRETLEVTLGVEVESQLGGDDFFMQLVGDNVDDAATHVRTVIEAEVGHLKEFYVHEITDLDHEITLGASFCKRNILVSPNSTRTQFQATITTLPTVPVLADLVAQKVFRSEATSIKEFTKFFFSIHDSLKEFDCRSDLIDILSGVYMELQPIPNFVITTTKRYVPLVEGVYDGFGNFSSNALLAKCDLVPSVLASSGYSYRVSKNQQLRYLLNRKRAIIRKTFSTGSGPKPSRVTLLTSELKRCNVIEVPGALPPSPTCVGGEEMIAEIKRARAAIRNWRNIGV
jgi:hypothetical protein